MRQGGGERKTQQRAAALGPSARASAAERGPRPVGAVLAELFARRGFAQVAADQQWQEIWASVAGEEIARASRVIGLRGGRLEIVVANSVLLQELATFQRQRLLGALCARLPESRLRSLRFRVGPIG